MGFRCRHSCCVILVFCLRMKLIMQEWVFYLTVQPRRDSELYHHNSYGHAILPTETEFTCIRWLFQVSNSAVIYCPMMQWSRTLVRLQIDVVCYYQTKYWSTVLLCTLLGWCGAAMWILTYNRRSAVIVIFSFRTRSIPDPWKLNYNSWSMDR
jgi:hypothetical protein